jgi:hypothetical protein
MLPDFILTEIRSKRRKEDAWKGFEDKLRILTEWSQDDAEKCALTGLTLTPDGDFLVDCPTLASLFQIKERSLHKNFNLCDYHRATFQGNSNLQLFAKRNHEREHSESIQRIVGQLDVVGPLNWDPSMTFHWEKFVRESPDPSVSNFCRVFRAERAHFLSPTVLLGFVLQSDIVSVESFQLIYEHFGPETHLFTRLNNFCVSVFSRGWGFGSGSRCVELLPDGVFRLTVDDQVVDLQNNFRELGYWLKNSDNERGDIESFFERHFPMETPSEAQLISFVERHFPAELFADEPPIMNEEEETRDGQATSTIILFEV